ncbi:MAG: circularly permuted type 2 ATP-grasp protein, partial [Hyphomicrobiaceae bacterium]|nr:circularly permuted type 2 ATP-grasp protein [Hyphomicrobiaceae bacterium]
MDELGGIETDERAPPSARSGGAMPFNPVAGYRPLAGNHDELFDATGTVRPHWRTLVSALSALGAAGMRGRFADADRYLRDTGVFYRVYGSSGSSERPWRLSHIPLVIPEEEWQTIEAGLVQRAELCEAVLTDLYGSQRLIADGSLPARIVAANPEFQRPFVNTAPQGGRHIHVYAADLGRGPDGRWWVLGDRTQGPSGLGFALENRLAMRRATPEITRALNVRQLAGFFQELRDGLSRRSRLSPPRVGLLTPGPFNQLYFEHAFLARYLGIALIEGGDLTVRGETAYVRTVAGLKPIDVLYRRLDGSYLDPLELDPGSQIGVPGLVSAIRAQNLALANSGGSGLMEARAMMAFMPALARTVLGEDLLLPNIATWWCGDEVARAEALASAETRVFARAFGQALPGSPGDGFSIGAIAPDGRNMARELETRGSEWTAQEVVQLSSLPVLTENGLDPRPFILRVFLTRGTNGWVVMPGGFCRVSDGTDARAISIQDGALSADVWISSRTPERPISLISSPGDEQVRRAPAILPTRAAENLYWLGRYMERAEQAMRLLRAHLTRALGLAEVDDPLLPELARRLEFFGIEDAEAPDAFSSGVGAILAAARMAASSIRDRLSPDAWQLVNETASWVASTRDDGSRPDLTLAHIENGLRQLAGFAGLAAENMSRLIGWRFMQTGRRLERAIATAGNAAIFAGEKAPEGALDLLLELTDSLMTYRQRYSVSVSRTTVLDLVLLDHNNPRSLAYQTEQARKHIEEFP